MMPIRKMVAPSNPRAAWRLAASAVLFTCLGCHSAFIEATVTNRTAAPISVVEVDYPSASFGTQLLAPAAVYHYRFKVLGSGPTKLLWIDSAHQDHTSAGPTLQEGQEGRIGIAIEATGASWTTSLHPAP